MSETVSGVRAVDWSERAAIGASFACLVHCLALPLLLSAAPALSMVLAVPESFHLWALAVAVPAAGFALWQGCLRHGAVTPLLAGSAGLALLVLGALAFAGGSWEAPATVAGSVTLVAAHLANWRFRHDCR